MLTLVNDLKIMKFKSENDTPVYITIYIKHKKDYKYITVSD